MDFAVYPWRFTFVARQSIIFPPGKATNVLRGGFGTVLRRVTCHSGCPGARECELRQNCAYARIFEPTGGVQAGPSGFADRPRPFVFRAAHLDGTSVSSGKQFHFDLHVFLRADPALAAFTTSFRELAREGLGATRGAADLQSVWQIGISREPHVEVSDSLTVPPPILFQLREPIEQADRLRISFVTPAELKSSDGLSSRPEFPIVFGRARDRISTLSTLYGTGPLDLDFRGLGKRSEEIRMKHCELRQVEVERLSSRTRQRHSLGGFVGQADYEGDLSEFLPILRAAEWTGIGRQTVWGKGEIRCFRLSA